MKDTYIIPEIERESVAKILARYEKKATAYGQRLVVEYGDPYATEVAVYEYGTDYDSGAMTRRKVGTQLVEVFDLTIEGGTIRKEGYAVVAKIEHLEGGNVVYVFGDVEHKAEWSEINPRCEHCGGNHGQKVTFIVRDENGNDKQVGRTCLKDYCGIDPKRVGWIYELRDIILGLEPESYDFREHAEAYAFSTLNALALALRVKKLYGYVSSGEPNSNKERLIDLARHNERPTEEEEAQAEAMLKVIKELDRSDAIGNLLDNVQSLAKCGYCKFSHFGYIAYAPVAYERYMAVLERQKERQAEKDAERNASEYVGNVGQRITFDVESAKLVTSWEGQWGYTYLYKIIDVAGNVLVWFASKPVPVEGAKKIKATVKDHSERDGVKQTVVTRCAVVAA